MNNARRSAAPDHVCAVCGLDDARALVPVTLGDGSAVSLCGSHAVMRERVGGEGAGVLALKSLLRDRRTLDRRLDETDELAAALSAAFGAERRTGQRRRA